MKEGGVEMTRYHGAEMVKPGIYLNVRQLTFKSMEEEGRLPGTADDTYRRVPMLAMFALAPILGLTYVIFLPLIGFAMVAWVGGAKVKQLSLEAGAALVRVLKPAWQPAMAFLTTGRTAKKKATAKGAEAKGAEEDKWAEEIEKELETGEENEEDKS
jgi:hypothetical protein